MLNAAFLLFDDGGYISLLKNLAYEHRVENKFQFLDKVPHQEMPSYYSILDVFVVPLITEPVCEIEKTSKSLEAMEAGIPVIASNVSALREMVQNKKTGLLFKAGDPDALVEACLRMSKNASLQYTIRLQARDYVTQKRDWTVVTSLNREIYNPAYD